MAASRAFPLSPGRCKLLTQLWENRETEEGDLTCSIPGGWWLGNERVSGNLGKWLLRYSLLRVSYTDSRHGVMGTYTTFVASEGVGRLLAEPDYVPEGVAVLRRLLPQCR